MRDRQISAIVTLAVACGGLGLASAGHATDRIGRSEILAHNCTGCHGTEGKGSLSIPKIRGLDRQDIAQSLKGFRSGEERQTIMGRIAKAYTDADIELLAEYFSSFK